MNQGHIHRNHHLTIQHLTQHLIHQTPSKKDKRKNQVHPENICCLCCILWETEEDKKSNSFWIWCSGKSCKCKKKCDRGCNWWVDNRCTHIHYENSDKGKANLEKRAEKNFSAQNT